MKYVKTFESLKDMYSGKDIGKSNSIYFVVSDVRYDDSFGNISENSKVVLQK